MILTGPPNPIVVYSYLLLGQGGWTYNQYNTVFLAGTLISSVTCAVIASKSEKVKFWKIMFIAAFFLEFSNMALTLTLYSYEVPKILYFVIYGTLLVINITALNMSFVPVVGRVSKYLPEGFESTGVTLIVSTFTFFLSFGTISTGWVLDAYNVSNGYYSRMKDPILICDTIYVASLFLAPLFLWTG